MTDARSVSSTVEVEVDPATAFTVFTEEMDLWWMRSPISFWDSARAVAKRCEPGVGGRLLEVYDDATADALELGRITVWEPPSLLAWHSSVDDVQIEVRFEPTPGGTLVSVLATIPEGGHDRGGTAYVRVTPAWLKRWVHMRDTAVHEAHDLGRLAVAVYYAKPATAIRWLIDAFGFDMPGNVPDDDSADGWIEFHVGDCAVMVRKQQEDVAEGAAPTHVPWVFVDDVDAHLARAEANGATIVSPIEQYGYRAYVAADLEGHRWTFAQARPTMRRGPTAGV